MIARFRSKASFPAICSGDHWRSKNFSLAVWKGLDHQGVYAEASLSLLGIHFLRGGREILFPAKVSFEFAGYGGLVSSKFYCNLSDGISFRRKIY